MNILLFLFLTVIFSVFLCVVIAVGIAALLIYLISKYIHPLDE